jgi:Phosphodiester glycosidase
MVRSVTPAGTPSGPWFTLRAIQWALVGGVALSVPLLVAVAWFGVHRISGLAPWLADSLRRVIGIEGVAHLEEAAYGVEDDVYAVWRRGERPRAYWAVPPGAEPSGAEPAQAEPASAQRTAPDALGAAPASALVVANAALVVANAAGSEPRSAPREGEAARDVDRAPFRPRNIGPMYAELDAPGDGKWVVLPDATPPADARMFKTLLHPDTERAWAELFVVALDLRRIRLHLVPGTLEPQATLPEALELVRPGRVPDEYHAGVIAAFNGGFKTEHGHYGMYVDGVTLVPPLAGTCTVARLKDGTLRIGTWSRLAAQLSNATWWRQTPDCMYENGKLNPRLAGGRVSKWGSTLDGETVVRRSAIGVDAAGTTLYVGISNHTTAPALARGMHHAGAATVAQLDINFSYPKFVTFREAPSSRLKVAVPLADGFEFSENEYLRKPSFRDFFYVTDSSMDARTARN